MARTCTHARTHARTYTHTHTHTHTHPVGGNAANHLANNSNLHMDLLHTVKIFHGDGLSVSLLASSETVSPEVIRLALEKMQVFEDKTFYQLYEGRASEAEDLWRPLTDEERPAHMQDKWTKKDLRFYLRRKNRESLELSNIINRHFTPECASELLNDLCLLEDLTEEIMVTNLKARFSKSSIYTYVGSILVSINPYYFFAIYNPKHTALYQGKPLGQLPPHIFAVADDAYTSMLADKENQSIVISGESGAGKTESTKFLLHHLMSLSAKIDKAQSLEIITLGTGPVLEVLPHCMCVCVGMGVCVDMCVWCMDVCGYVCVGMGVCVDMCVWCMDVCVDSLVCMCWDLGAN